MQLPTFIFQTREALEEWSVLAPEEREELVKYSSWFLEESLIDLHDGRLSGKLLTPTDVAKRLEIPLGQVWELVKAKRLPRVNHGSVYRFRPWAVELCRQRLERKRNRRDFRVVSRSG